MILNRFLMVYTVQYMLDLMWIKQAIGKRGPQNTSKYQLVMCNWHRNQRLPTSVDQAQRDINSQILSIPRCLYISYIYIYKYIYIYISYIFLSINFCTYLIVLLSTFLSCNHPGYTINLLHWLYMATGRDLLAFTPTFSTFNVQSF